MARIVHHKALSRTWTQIRTTSSTKQKFTTIMGNACTILSGRRFSPKSSMSVWETVVGFHFDGRPNDSFFITSHKKATHLRNTRHPYYLHIIVPAVVAVTGKEIKATEEMERASNEAA